MEKERDFIIASSFFRSPFFSPQENRGQSRFYAPLRGRKSGTVPSTEGSGEGNLDWDYILKESIRHGVAPLIYNNLKGRIPKEMLSSFEGIYHATAFKNMTLLKEAKRIVNTLNEKGIKTIPIKGASLAERLYENIALRPFEDIDILVKKRDLDVAIELLKIQGYIPRNQNHLKSYRKWHFNLTMDKSGKIPVCLELHWALRDRFSLQLIDLEGIWQRSKDNHMAEIDEFLYLCNHLDMHGYLNRVVQVDDDPDWVRGFVCNRDSENRLIWFSDLWHFLLKYQEVIQPDLLEERAKEWGITSSLKNCLIILDRITTDTLSKVSLRETGFLTCHCEGRSPEAISRQVRNRLRNLAIPEVYRPLMFLPCSKGFRSRFLYRLVMGGPPPLLSNENVRKRWFLKKGQNTQFRPVRLIDMVRYILPQRSYLKRCYPRLSGVWPLAFLMHLVLLITRHTGESISFLLERRKSFTPSKATRSPES